MIITALAAETYMEYEFTYENNYELFAILLNLEKFKNKSLCKEYQVVPDYSIKSTSGSVYACIRCDSISTLCHRLDHISDEDGVHKDMLIKIEKAVKRVDNMILPVK